MIAAALAGPASPGAHAGLTAAARHAAATAGRAGFTSGLNQILLIGAAIAAIAAITPLTLIRGRDFAAQPAAEPTAPGTARPAGRPAAEPVTT